MRRMYAQAGRCVLLPHGDERKLHPSGHAERRGSRHHQGHVQVQCRKDKGKESRVQLLGSGTILREVIAAAELLEKDFGVAADVWSVTSFTELRRDGIDCERWNMLHPEAKPRVSYVEQCLDEAQRPGDRRDRLHAFLCRPDSPLRPKRISRRWARMVLAAPTRARNCAVSSRWIATTSPSLH